MGKWFSQGGFHGTPLCTNGSAGYLMQLSVLTLTDSYLCWHGRCVCVSIFAFCAPSSSEDFAPYKQHYTYGQEVEIFASKYHVPPDKIFLKHHNLLNKFSNHHSHINARKLIYSLLAKHKPLLNFSLYANTISAKEI